MFKSRPAWLIGISLAIFALSVTLFGWSSLGWWRPMAEGNAGGGGYLILYTTEPDSVNEARLTLEPDAGGHLRGILSIDLGAISDELHGG